MWGTFWMSKSVMPSACFTFKFGHMSGPQEASKYCCGANSPTGKLSKSSMASSGARFL